jgi:hypothetical protein
MQFDPGQKNALAVAEWRRWRHWIKQSMSSLSKADPAISEPPAIGESVHTEALGRIARQIELIAGTLARVSA